MTDNLRVLTVTIPALVSGTIYADHPSIALGNSGAGPINTISAQMLPQSQWGIGLRTEIIDNDPFSDQQLEDLEFRGIDGVHSVDEIRSTNLSIGYGLGERLSISTQIPYIERINIREIEDEIHEPGQESGHHNETDAGPSVHSHGSATGFGDALFLGRYSMPPLENTEIALLFGIKAPTGETHAKDAEGVRFEADLQPGSGSWDFLIGSAVGKEVENLSFHGNILVNWTTEGSQSTRIGESISYGAAVSYRHHSHGSPSHHRDHHHEDSTAFQWDLMLELHGETRVKNEISGQSETNTGGTNVFLSPGVKASLGAFNGFLSLSLPVISDLNGEQSEPDHRIVAGFSVAI